MAIELRVAIDGEGKDDHQLPCQSPSPPSMGALVVNPIDQFDRRVALVQTSAKETGYLRIRIISAPWSDGRLDPGVDMDLVVERSGEWQFSDRADPEDAAALNELRGGIIDWYGEKLTVIRWLEPEEAGPVVAEFFAP